MDDTSRLAALHAYGVLDSPKELRFDRLTAFAADLFGVKSALLSLVDENRQWFKAAHGLEVRETPRDWAFCDHAIRDPAVDVLVVPDAMADQRFQDNPLVTGPPHIRFYAGAVLRTPTGDALGTLCLLDPNPRPDLSEVETRRLRDLAALAMDELELSRIARDAEARIDLLRLAEAMSGVGRWRYLVTTGKVEWSDEVYRIHGVTRETFDPNLGDALDFYVPEDRSAVTSALESAITTGDGFGFELRLQRADGDLRHVRCRGVVELDSRGATSAVTGVFQDVTADVRRLASIERSERRFRLLADNMGDVITQIGSDGSSTYISPAIETLIGWTPTEMRGRSALDFVHADHRAVVADAMIGLSGSANATTVEHQALHRNGTSVWVETRFKFIREKGDGDGKIVAVIRDISSRKAAEEALAESDQRYRLLAENANDMIARMKPGGEIMLVTPGCMRVLGYSPAELLGTLTVDRMHPGDLPMVMDYFSRLQKLGPGGVLPPYQFRGRHRDGHWVWLEGQPRMFFEEGSGEPFEIQDVVRDITSRKALELDLEDAKAAADRAAAAKSDFLSTMSHEIRTPLNGVLGFADVLARTTLDADQKRYVDRIRGAGRGLSALIDDILDVAKVEAGKMSVEESAFDLKALVAEVVDLTRQVYADRIAFGVEWESAVARGQLGDERKVRQILLNLLSNAAKFTSEGGVAVHVQRDRGNLLITVSDTGIGISADALGELFENFTQADNTVGRRYRGTGLGLSISRAFARLLGGDIVLTSVTGEGTQAQLTIPYRPCDVVAADEAKLVVNASARRLDLLVVDDVEANLELMSIILSQEGHNVTGALSGHDALVILETGRTFDAVLMDIQMPEMDGFQTTRRIRALVGPTAQVPIMALSANVLPEHVEQCRAAGMIGHLRKPVDRAALNTALQNLPQTSQRAPAHPATGETSSIVDPLEELIGRYKLSLGTLAEDIEALTRGPSVVPWSQLGFIAHQAAGSAGSFGFQAVSEAAVRLEAAARAAREGEESVSALGAAQALATEARLAAQ